MVTMANDKETEGINASLASSTVYNSVIATLVSNQFSQGHTADKAEYDNVCST